MQRTKIIDTEISTPISAGFATSVSNASCVRLHNNTSGIVTVYLSESVGSATTVNFSMPGNSVEFLEKFPTEVIWTSDKIKDLLYVKASERVDALRPSVADTVFTDVEDTEYQQ